MKAAPSYGQITGTLDGVDGTWLIELAEDGGPIATVEEDIVYIPVTDLPGVIPVWSIALPVGAADGVSFTPEEAALLGVVLMRRAAEKREEAAGR